MILNNNNFIKFFINKDVSIAPHLPCININYKKLKNIINFYYLNNIKKLVILRGDNKTYFKYNFFSYNFNNIININYKLYFKIYTAIYIDCHYKSYNYNEELKNCFLKINSKANYGITQYFYNIDSLYNFINVLNSKKRKIIKIIPGIMPLNNLEQLIKFSNICKTEIPKWILKILNNKSIFNFNKFNLNFIINFVFKIINYKINNIHFYSMNKIDSINYILEKLNNNINV